MSKVRAFQIFYSDATRAAVDPDFEPLDNSANERPDWYEYWPIRDYFTRSPLEEASYYGFFSPLFFSKTRLRGSQVLDFVRQAGDVDVVTFSPHPCHSACFYNVFEQGASFFPGFLELAAAFLRDLDPAFRLEGLVNHSRNTVYSNYFVARPRFWREWLGVLGRVFDLAETRSSSLYEALNRPVVYSKDEGESKPAQMKIMLMERIASLLLSSGAFPTSNYDSFLMPLSKTFVGHLAELKALDALKVAYADSADARYLRQFVERRDRLFVAVGWRPT
jgi:hypothetical protein